MLRSHVTSCAALLTSLFASSLAFAQAQPAPAAPAPAPAAPAPAAPAAPAPAPAVDAANPSAATPAPEVAASGSAEAAPTEASTSAEPEEASVVTSPEPTPASEPKAPVDAVEPVPTPEAKPQEEAPSLLPLAVGTHTFARFELRSGYDELGVSRQRFQEGDQTVFRSRISFETNPLKLTPKIQASLYVAPQASGQWGASGTGGTIGEANVGFYEGYFKVKGEHLEGKVGRFAMNYGEAVVIGDLDWHQSGRAFDGAHFRLSPGKATVDAFVTQTAEGHPALQEPFEGDTYFYGAYAALGKAIADKFDLDAYVLALTVAAADLVDAGGVPYHRNVSTLTTLGARVKQTLGVFDYRLEAGVQLGETSGAAPTVPGATATSRETVAYQADAEIGVSPISALRLSLGGVIASGDDPSTPGENEGWNELYPTGHKFLGLMDVIGARTNVASGIFKIQVKPGESTTLKLDSHIFARVEDGGLGRVGEESLAGLEFNAMVNQNIGKWVYVNGLLGLFVPQAGHYASDELVSYGELQSGLKF